MALSRLRAFAVTVALVLGAGTMSAVAAPLLRSDMAPHPAGQAQRQAAKTSSPGNGHGKAVSNAARGGTPPVGDCRNHGHWVSTVAKGLASCDDNPRPATGKPADD